MNSALKNLFLWLIIAVVLVAIFSNFGPKQVDPERMAYSQFIHEVKKGKIKEVTIEERNINAIGRDNTKIVTYMPLEDQSLLPRLIEKGVGVKVKPPEKQSLLMHIFINWLPMLLLIGSWLFLMRQRILNLKKAFSGFCGKM